MLEPQSRAALTDLLHPPSGFSLSHAVATTFTLDLDAALTIPLAFAARRLTADDDPIGILDAVRRAADRVDIFVQAGQIGIEIPPSALVAFLEPMIHPVEVPRGIFHPKVWFLEYERGEERTYRFICASRNLTSDRSWDVVVALDGTPATTNAARATARQVNAPLVELLRALPDLAITPLPSARRTRVAKLAASISDVVWEAPLGMRDLQFHVWGIGEKPQPDFWGVRGLFISPFLSDDGLNSLKKGAYGEAYLVSRAHSIDCLAPSTFDKRLRNVYVLDDAVEFQAGDDRDHPDTGAPPRSILAGLHAKTYIFDRRDGAHVFLGSLNATDAALHENIEVMVELTGPASRFGVQATLEGLGELLEEFEYQGGLEETEQEKADRDLAAVLRRVAGARLHARVVEAEPYELHVYREQDVTVPPDVELSWHPITRTGLRIPGLPGPQDAPTVVPQLELPDITPFVIVTARDARGDRHAQTTVVMAKLHDDPAERRDAIVAAQLTDRAAFLRFLLLLLELGGFALPKSGGGGAWRNLTGAGASGAGLFEALMKSAGANTDGLAEVQRVVDYLSRQPDGSQVLPHGFEQLWASVWEAHQSLRKAQDE